MDGIFALDLLGCIDRSIALFKEHESSSERSLSKRKSSMIKLREAEYGGDIQSTSFFHQIEKKQ